jgi:biotin--protein ligase
VTNTIATLTPILSPYYSITTITNPNTFITDPWQPSTALLIFPGGRDVPYCHSLNGSPNAAITSWIRHRGGKFLGFCAGGYYGSKRCEFEVGDPVLEVVGTRELGFFGGTCRGAAFEGFVYDKEDGARAAGLKVLGLEGCEEEIKCYCNGGGVFVGAEEMEGKGVEVLARFTEKVKVEGGDVAAVYCKVGAGAAILTGVHPE